MRTQYIMPIMRRVIHDAIVAYVLLPANVTAAAQTEIAEVVHQQEQVSTIGAGLTPLNMIRLGGYFRLHTRSRG